MKRTNFSKNIDNLNDPITIKETKYVILKFPKKEISRLRGFYWRILPNV